LIESVFSNPKSKIKRVKNWKQTTDQVQRWAAVHLLEQEKTFRKVKQYSFIEEFLKNFIGQNKNINIKRETG